MPQEQQPNKLAVKKTQAAKTSTRKRRSKNKKHRQKAAGCVSDGLLSAPWRCALAWAPGDAFQGDRFAVLGHFYAQRNEICRSLLPFASKCGMIKMGNFAVLLWKSCCALKKAARLRKKARKAVRLCKALQKGA